MELEKLLSAANAVPGFDPAAYATKSEDGGSSYLKVFYRKMWFRLKYPNGKISTSPVALKDNTCIFKAEVFLDKNDAMPIANAYASRTYREGAPFSEFYIENAETAAIGRALANAGFNIGYAPGEDDEQNAADAPIATEKMDEKKKEKKEEAAPTEKPKRSYKRKAKTEKTAEAAKTEDVSKTEAAEKEDASVQNNVIYSSAIEPGDGNAVELPDSVKETETPADCETAVQDEIIQLTKEEAARIVITFGRNKGLSLGELALQGKHGIDDIDWLANKYNGPDKRLQKAAGILISAATA